MTIEERAYKEYPIVRGNNTTNDAGWSGYVKGAIDQDTISRAEQKKIDIEKGKKFCKAWLDEIIDIYLPDLKAEPYYTQALHHTYKKYEQAMEE